MDMYLPRNSLFVVFVCFFFSCGSEKQSSVNTFYNLDSLLKAQIAFLAERKPILQKTEMMDGREDTIELSDMDTTDWAEELGIFRQLDLNSKPINRENYAVASGIPDPNSNLLIREYTSTEDLPVTYMKIYYQEKLENPRKIEGQFYEDNGLYVSTRSMILELSKLRNKTVLSNYTITGRQKMVLGDSVKFKVTGKLVY